MTLSSPSARRREHVRGRWSYQIDLGIGREKTVHSAKQAFGVTIPWLMISLPVFLATSRAATELASWGLAVLTLFYIAVDAFARHREFKFFRLGPDLSLGACLSFGLISVLVSLFQSTDPAATFIDGLSAVRWIPLLYLFVYAWELFPGLNRVMFALVGVVTFTAIATWIQHFQGVDWLSGEALANAPTGRLPYFVPRGFFGSTEALATLLACVLPFPFAAACLRRGREMTDKMTWVGFGLSVVISLALFFTYRPGLWWAGVAGAASLLLFPADRRFKLFASIAATIAVVFGLLFVAPSLGTEDDAATLWDRITTEETGRADQHRKQMNQLVTVWEQSPVIGVAGNNGTPLAQTEAVNVYFIILAHSGVIGLSLYLIFILHHLLNTLRLFQEIPASHHKHRILAAGCFGSQCAFHVAGLHWGTMSEAFSMNLFILVSSITIYLNEHYAHGLVPDDNSL